MRESSLEDARGTCLCCDRRLGAYSAVRGRDGRLDEEAFFTDRFCSHACYHAFGQRAVAKSAMARWN